MLRPLEVSGLPFLSPLLRELPRRPGGDDDGVEVAVAQVAQAIHEIEPRLVTDGLGWGRPLSPSVGGEGDELSHLVLVV